MKRSNEYDIRSAVVRNLLLDGVAREDIRIEIPLDTASSNGRVDILVLGEDLRCIELKSGKDKYTPESIKEQLRPYRRIFDYVAVIVDDYHYKEWEEDRFNSWGGYKIKRDNWSEVTASYNHKDKIVKPKYNNCGIYSLYKNNRLCAADMLQVLWRKEVGEITGKKSSGKWDHTALWSEEKPIKEIRQIVIKALKTRPLNKWEEKFWKQFDESNNQK